MLKIDNLHTSYGKIAALKGITLEVAPGEIATLIGANGAGKTTAMKTIAGILRPKQGTITSNGIDITRMPAHKIVRLGISLSPEGRKIFPELTVHENLEMGAFTRKRGELKEDTERVFEFFPRLRDRQAQRGGTLSGGEQQMLAMGRALMARPTLLMLDEPSLGLAPLVVETIFDIITKINNAGTAILLVEQNANMALSIASRGYVMESGHIVLSGPAQQLMTDENVRRAYLGITD